VTRSTQTQKDLNFLSPKTITFKAELSPCDVAGVTGVASPEEYDGLKFIDDDPDTRRENPGQDPAPDLPQEKGSEAGKV
jgi:hypothetical protein